MFPECVYSSLPVTVYKALLMPHAHLQAVDVSLFPSTLETDLLFGEHNQALFSFMGEVIELRKMHDLKSTRSCVWWHTPVLSVLGEAEAEE